MEFPDLKYRQICSTITLHSAKEGFFTDFLATVIEKVGNDWIENVFAKRHLEKDKIEICCTEEKVMQSFL